MAAIAPIARPLFRFAVPASLGTSVARTRGAQLEAFLGRALGMQVQVTVAASYEALAKDLLAGRAEAAWAPPFVCARMEAMGVRVLVRGVRRGASSYRAALVARAGSGLTLAGLAGKTVAWVDPHSTGGHLLAVAHLKSRGLEPSRTFFAQTFCGSYQSALEAVEAGRAQVTSVFCPPERTGLDFRAGLEEVLPGRSAAYELVDYTEETPNEGISVSMQTDPSLVAVLERELLALGEGAEGAELLRDIFNAEAFERAPRMGYRSLYRIALASL